MPTANRLTPETKPAATNATHLQKWASTDAKCGASKNGARITWQVSFVTCPECLAIRAQEIAR